ncbi:MAG TPA: DUF6508 domain-containing protein [Mycobacteriales bacterium]|nr:DUF6508 domain-containing protein [Mycobacteriales bacterium]
MNPTDAEVEAALRAAPPDRWRDLAAAVAAVEAADGHATWAGGATVDGATQAPYPVYSAAVERLLAAVGRVGAIVVFAWPGWDGLDRYDDPTRLRHAPAADAARLVTAIVRGERFGDGTIANAVDDGRLPAAVRRLLDWYETPAEHF